jgi:hypothetical protein
MRIINSGSELLETVTAAAVILPRAGAADCAGLVQLFETAAETVEVLPVGRQGRTCRSGAIADSRALRLGSLE